jgi:L-lactate utilization protein LutC
MTKLTIEQIRTCKAELEKQIAKLLSEFEKDSGISVADVRCLDAGILSKNKPYVHIVTEVNL